MKTTQKGTVTKTIIFILLIISLLYFLIPALLHSYNESFVNKQRKDSYDKYMEINSTSTDKINTTDGSGIVITSIDSKSLPVFIKGYVSDNIKWTIFEGEAGVIKLFGTIDGKEKEIAISPITILDFNYEKKPPFYFDFSIGDRQYVSSLDNNTGYLLLTEAGAKDGEFLNSVKVPIEFDIK